MDTNDLRQHQPSPITRIIASVLVIMLWVTTIIPPVSATDIASSLQAQLRIISEQTEEAEQTEYSERPEQVEQKNAETSRSSDIVGNNHTTSSPSRIAPISFDDRITANSEPSGTSEPSQSPLPRTSSIFEIKPTPTNHVSDDHGAQIIRDDDIRAIVTEPHTDKHHKDHGSHEVRPHIFINTHFGDDDTGGTSLVARPQAEQSSSDIPPLKGGQGAVKPSSLALTPKHIRLDDRDLLPTLPSPDTLIVYAFGGSERIEFVDQDTGRARDVLISLPLDRDITNAGVIQGQHVDIWSSEDGQTRQPHMSTTVTIRQGSPFVIFPTDHLTLYAVGPSIANFVINDDNPTTTSQTVTLTNTIRGATQMKIGNSLAAANAATREPFDDQKTWTLTPGGGIKEVHAIVQDVFGNTGAVSDTIEYVDPVIGPSDPSTIPGLSLRLDAQDLSTITTVGSRVAERRDRTANDYDFDQTVTTDRPTRKNSGINGLPSVLFDGNGDNLEDLDGETLINGKNELTIISVIQSNNVGHDRGRFVTEVPTGGDNGLALRYDASGWLGGAINTIKMSIENASNNGHQYEGSSNRQSSSPQLITVDRASNESYRLRVDGMQDSPTSSVAPINGPIDNAERLILGRGTKDGPSAGRDGFIGEFLVFDRVLTTSERQNVECYLQTKRELGPCSNTPTGIPGTPTLRFDAQQSTGITISGPAGVQGREDRANGYDALQTTTSRQPSIIPNGINGHPAIAFDGNSDFLPIQTLNYRNANLNGVYICVVFQTDYNGGGNNWAFLDFDRSENINFTIRGNGTLGRSYRAGSIIDNYSTNRYNNNQGHLACAEYDNTLVNDTKIVVNGQTEYLANRRTNERIGRNSTRYGFIGDGSEASSFNGGRNNIYYNGRIGEIIYYENALTDTEEEELQCYLADKRDISVAGCDDVAPTATVTYSPSRTIGATTGSVTATLTGFSEPVTITNNGGSPDYTFTSNGSFTYTFVDNAGNIGETTATVTWITPVAPSGTVTIPVMADTFLDGDVGFRRDVNFGIYDFIVLGGGSFVLLKFDLTTIPVGSTVTDARLRLTRRANNGSTFSVHAMTNNDWIEGVSDFVFSPRTYNVNPGEPTFNHREHPGTAWAGGGPGLYPGTDYDGTSLTVSTPTFTNYNNPTDFILNADGRTRVTNWINDSSTNRGFVLANGNEWMFMSSKDEGIAAFTPQLVITYAPDTVPPTATVTYSPPTATFGSVVATLTGFSEPVTILNNGGSPDYTFTSNGSFTYAFSDAAGNIGYATAVVDWISTALPAVLQSDPADGDIDVSISDPRVLTFNKAMDTSITDANALINVSPSAGTLAGSRSGNQQFVITHPALTHATTYGVSVSTGFADLSGNFLIAPYEFTFTTESTSAIAPSTTTFVESINNDGTVATTMTVTSTNVSFDPLIATNGSVTASGVPAGLSLDVSYINSSTITIQLAGVASPHDNFGDTFSMEIVFGDDAFLVVPASLVSGSTISAVSVDFYNPFEIDLYPVGDARLDASNPDRNFGATDTADVLPAGDAFVMRFDTSSLPAGAQVIDADLIMTKFTNGAGQSFSVRELNDANIWFEGVKNNATATAGEVTYNNRAHPSTTRQSGTPGLDAGIDYGLTDVVTSPAFDNPTGQQTKSFPFNAAGTGLIQSWIDTPSLNDSLVIVNSDAQLRLGTSDQGTLAPRPRIRIRYRLTPPPPAGTLEIRSQTEIDLGTVTVTDSPIIQTATINDALGVTDTKAANDRYTTVSISDLTSTAATIPASSVEIRVDTPIVTLSGTANPYLSLDSAVTSSRQSLDTPITYLEKGSTPHTEVGTYSTNPTFRVTVPAYAQLGAYTGTLVYTLYE